MLKEQYYEEETFTSLQPTENDLAGKEFELCTFENCNFSEADFSHTKFTECNFINCNLAMVKLTNTSLKTVDFQNCKLTGVDFSECNDFIFAVGFTGSILDFASFIKMEVKNTHFCDCHIHEANFTRSNLENAVFENCDLKGAIFSHTKLMKCDFVSAYNFIIDPNENNVRKAKFSLDGLPGLLQKYRIIVA
jgi:uncharacterized protein YjbI with pentapeptide repeats